MTPHVGVLGWLEPRTLKHELLLFDQLAIPRYPGLASVSDPGLLADLEWLIGEGLVLEADTENLAPERPPTLEDLDEILSRISQAYFMAEYALRTALASNSANNIS